MPEPRPPERRPRVTTLLRTSASDPAILEPIDAALAEMRYRLGAPATHGVHPGLLISDPTGFVPAAALIDGSRLPYLLDTAKQRWGAQPHAAAALAWKAYTYWLVLPAVAGYVAARRVPLPAPADVLLQVHDHQPFLTIGYRQVPVAVLPADPVATDPDVAVRPDDRGLLAAFRASVRDAHLDPLLDRIRARVNIGRRTMLGSLASGVAYAVQRCGSTVDTARTMLEALDVADLVDLETEPDGGWRVWRRTCCLAFTLPEPKICSGCCIRPR